VCAGGFGVFLVSVWRVLPVGEYEEGSRWGAGFISMGVGYGMFHGFSHGCVVVFGVRDIAPLPCKGGVATARG
jgi:hypothetical protein